MAVLTLNGSTVVDGTIRMPRIGVWHADLKVDARHLPASPVTLTSEGNALTLKGTVTRVEVWQDAVLVRVVGGAGRLGTWLDPKFYCSVPLRIPLADIASESGEKVAGSAEANQHLDVWSRFAGPAYLALRALTDIVALSWRILPNGTIWVGRESWPELRVIHDLIDKDPMLGSMVIGVPAPSVLPGMTFDGRRVSYVVHRVQAQQVRSELFMEH